MNRIKAIVVVVLSALSALATPLTSAHAVEPGSAVTALARLDQLNNQVEKATGALDLANRKLAEDTEKGKALDLQITSLARLQYKRPILLVRFLEANSLNQILGDLSSDRLMASKERDLLLQAKDLRRQDQQARDEANVSLAAIRTSRDEAQKLADEAVAARDAELRARALAIAQAQYQPGQGGASLPSNWAPGSGAFPNRFVYGYCTWYVANKRYIPFLGNAIDWWPNARAYGFAEGGAPRVGAVMVTRESGYGHVAYVEAVHADGSWTVSEMNFVGWNVVSSRTIRPGQTSVVGFIY